jgi:hypothetical protein
VLWVDPALDLVIASHWTEGIATFVREVTEIVSSS